LGFENRVVGVPESAFIVGIIGNPVLISAAQSAWSFCESTGEAGADVSGMVSADVNFFVRPDYHVILTT